MTLPDERYRSVKQTRDFLWKLAGGEFPRTPKIVRQHAASLLRHYPSEWELDRAAEGAPDVFAKRMEDVQRMFMKYEQGKKNEA
jgi:hypothetical protein